MTSVKSSAPEDIARTLGLGAGRPPPRWRRRGFWLALLALVVIVWILIGARGEQRGPTYETTAVKRGDLTVTVSATGTLQPVKQVDVGIEVSGTIKTVEVDYNDNVAVGQVLARLDTTKLEAQVLQSEASLDAARAKLLQVQATVQENEAQLARFTKVRETSGGKVPAQSDFDAQVATLARARADEASARASINQGQATLNANRADLSKAVLVSPINGVVLTRSVEPGQTVAAAFQSPVLFTLAEDLAQIELQVDVDEADVGQVKTGQAATFTVDAFPDRRFPARITQVRYGSETVNGVVTYKAVLQVSNADLLLRPGMTATAVIVTQEVSDVLLVPNAALRFAPPAESTAKKSGSLVSSILPRPPSGSSRRVETIAPKTGEQTVWALVEGQLTPLVLGKGMTDGLWTEVASGPITAGLNLVTASTP